jgi:hypothetical protein
MGDYSSFLFARPSVAEGVGRLLDFGDTLTEYNRSPSEEQADINAAWCDWLAVAADLRGAMRSFAQSEPRLSVCQK